MQWNYVVPWCRFSPYIVGILLGYFLHNTKSKPFKMSQATNLWGWVIAIATGLAIVYGLGIPKIVSGEKELTMTENVLYGGFHRLGWAIAVSWVIFTCCRGYGGTYCIISLIYRLSPHLKYCVHILNSTFAKNRKQIPLCFLK